MGARNATSRTMSVKIGNISMSLKSSGHRHGHMQEEHDGDQNRRRWPYRHGLEEDIEPHFGAEGEVGRC